MARSAPRPALLVLALLAAAPATADVGSEFVLAPGAGSRSELVAVPDGANGAYVAWTDRTADPNGNIHVTHIAAGGGLAPGWPLGGIPLATSATAEHLPQLVPDGSGGVICVWQVPLLSTIHTLYASRLSAAGLFLWGSLPVALTPPPEEYVREATSLSVVADGAGGVWIGYLGIHHATGIEALPRVHHLNRFAGLDAELAMSTVPNGTPGPTAIARDPASGAVTFVWSETAPGRGDSDLRVQRVLANGVRDPRYPEDGLVFGGAVGNQFAPALAADSAGGVWVAWLEQFGPDADVIALRLADDGQPRPFWPAKGVALTDDEFPQQAPRVVRDANGDLVAAWIDLRSGSPNLRVGRLDPRGVTVAGWGASGRPVTQSAGSAVSAPVIAATPDGSYFAAWQSAASGGDADVFAARITPLGNVTPFPAGLPVHAVAGVDESRPALAADSTGGAWIAWVDRRSGGDEVWARHVTAEAVLGAPRADARLALLGTRPAPARGPGARLAFALPDGGPARLALYDVAGRRAWSREVGSLGAGVHAVPLGDGLAPGLYLARLAHASGVRTARVVVSR